MERGSSTEVGRFNESSATKGFWTCIVESHGTKGQLDDLVYSTLLYIVDKMNGHYLIYALDMNVYLHVDIMATNR